MRYLHTSFSVNPMSPTTNHHCKTLPQTILRYIRETVFLSMLAVSLLHRAPRFYFYRFFSNPHPVSFLAIFFFVCHSFCHEMHDFLKVLQKSIPSLLGKLRRGLVENCGLIFQKQLNQLCFTVAAVCQCCCCCCLMRNSR